MDRSETKKVLENAVKVATSIIPDMEELLGIQAKIMWSRIRIYLVFYSPSVRFIDPI